MFWMTWRVAGVLGGMDRVAISVLDDMGTVPIAVFDDMD